MMRTTLTLDDDVAAELERHLKARDVSFKALVNDVLRAGLKQLDAPPKHRPLIHTHGVDLGQSRLPQMDDITDVLAQGEGDGFR
jgi:hypothetical protein